MKRKTPKQKVLRKYKNAWCDWDCAMEIFVIWSGAIIRGAGNSPREAWKSAAEAL